MLEDRVVPSILSVNSSADSTAPSNSLTLREAILLVDNGGNAQAALGRGLTAGEAGQISGTFGVNDTIQFDTGLDGQTITLNGSMLPRISQDVTINGLGAGNLAISGNNQSRIFIINSGTQVSISDLTIEYGSAGTSYGDEIYNGGTLTVSDCTFLGNPTSASGDIYNGGTLAVSYGSAGFNGTLILNNVAATTTATFSDGGNFTGDLIVNNSSNLQSLSVTGTITAGSSIGVVGTLSNSTIGANSGTVSAGSISSMTLATNGSGGSILASGSITGLSATENDGFINLSGQGTASNVSIGTNNGTLEAGTPGTIDTGTLTNSTVGTNNGTVSAGSISSLSVAINSSGASILAGAINGMSVGINSGTFRAAGQGTTTGLTVGTNTSTGTISAPEDGSSGSGTMTSTTITSNAGTVSTGSISGMSVGTNSGTISAAGQGTTSNLTVGTNTSTGTISAPEDGSSGSGTMTSTTITSNAGSVSTGSISGMSVGTNSGTISAAGQGTATGLTVGTNTSTGTISAPEDGSSGSGTMTSTTITSNAGTVSTGSISGMSVGTNSGTISAAGQGTTSNLTVGTNTSTGTISAPEDGSSGSGTMTSTTITSNAGSVSTGSISGMSVGTNSGTISAAGQGTMSNLTVGTNTSTGTISAPEDTTSGSGTMTSTTITSNAGSVSTGSISGMSVGTNSGTIAASGSVTNFSVSAFSGVLSAVNVAGSAQILSLVDGGVARQLVLSPVTAGGPLPQYVSYVYDHNANGDAELTMSVNEGPNTGSYDVELLSSSAAPGSGFDLAALYNAGSAPSHIRNVLIEGNLAPSSGDDSPISIPSGVSGVYLPGTALASVGIMGNAPAGSVNAASVQAVSFASLAENCGTVTASAATATDAAQLLACGTAIVQANNTFLAAAGQTATASSQTAAQFLDTGTSGAFDCRSVLIGNQGSVDPIAPSATPVLAQVTAASSCSAPSTIQTINLIGNGGSLQTGQVIAGAITSIGDLGDLILQAPQGIVASITAASIFGNIAASNGGISGTIQTTAGNIGRVLFSSNGSLGGVTSIQASSGLTGTILSAGDLISKIKVSGGFRGTLAAGGNLGYLQLTPWGTLDRFGGITVSGGFNGDAVFLGNIYGDISISGGLNGRIAAQGQADGLVAGRQGILGNINISNGVGSSAAIVSGGEIGDVGSGTCTNFYNTDLDVSGGYRGILAAVGQISYEISGGSRLASIFNNAGSISTSGQAIDNIFNGQTQDDLTLGGLTFLLANLNALQVCDGNLIDP